MNGCSGIRLDWPAAQHAHEALFCTPHPLPKRARTSARARMHTHAHACARMRARMRTHADLDIPQDGRESGRQHHARVLLDGDAVVAPGHGAADLRGCCGVGWGAVWGAEPGHMGGARTGAGSAWPFEWGADWGRGAWPFGWGADWGRERVASWMAFGARRSARLGRARCAFAAARRTREVAQGHRARFVKVHFGGGGAVGGVAVRRLGARVRDAVLDGAVGGPDLRRLTPDLFFGRGHSGSTLC
jgi:hypothetical protein